MTTIDASRRWALAALAAGLMLVAPAAGPVRAEEKAAETKSAEKERTPESEPRGQTAGAEASQPRPGPGGLYVPPEIGFPGRRIGAGTRGWGRVASLQILAPDHLGYTTEEQPTLYWYLAELTPIRVDFTIRDESSVEPLVDVRLPQPVQAGIQAVRLADHGVRLRTGANYHWFVSLIPDPERRSKDFTAGAWIARIEPDPALREKLAGAGGSQALVYAESGLWYDAIGALSAQIAAAPRNAALRGQRAALLEQVGLSEVAAFDRGAASQP